MVKWSPKIPNQLTLDQGAVQSLYQKRKFCLIGILLLGGFLAFLLSANSLLAKAIFLINAILFISLYIRWRKFLFSYWYTYTSGSNRSYYEDYSWKDSLVMALILIVGTGLCGFVLFYVASKVDFTNLQSVARTLRLLI